jgi:hypothetical protein
MRRSSGFIPGCEGRYLVLLFPALVLASMAPQAVAQPREVPVAVYGKDASTVPLLEAENIEIEEDGERRALIAVRRDDRPVDVALILDSSQWMDDDYRDILIPAAAEFWQALPEGSRVTIWTCGGRVAQPVPFGTDLEAARESLQQQVTGGPNFGLQALSEVSSELAKHRGLRRYVVLASTTSIVGSKNLMDQAFRALPEAAATPILVLVESSGTLGGYRLGGEGRNWDVESVLEDLAVGYGGSYELVLTTQAVGKVLQRVAAAISSEFLVRFESEVVSLKRPKVRVKQKDVKLLWSGYARKAR